MRITNLLIISKTPKKYSIHGDIKTICRLPMPDSLAFWKYQNEARFLAPQPTPSQVYNYIFSLLLRQYFFFVSWSQNKLKARRRNEAGKATDYNLYLSTWNMFFSFSLDKIYTNIHKLKYSTFFLFCCFDWVVWFEIKYQN